jgi:hypothetical protein
MSTFDPKQPIRPGQGQQNPNFDNPREYGTPPKQKPRFNWKKAGIATAVFLLVAIVLGQCGGDDQPDAVSPVLSAATVTVTQTAPAPAPATSTVPRSEATTASPEPSEEVTEESQPAPEEFNPSTSDFKVKIKVVKKQCFGSAGCNVTYRIDPEYVGDDPLPTSGSTEVTYEVSGGEDGPAINTFTVDDTGTAHFDETEDASTSSQSKKLKAEVTEVVYTP